MVHQDNVTFLFERQIFTQGFFEAVKDLYEIILGQQPAAPHDPALFLFLERLVFEIVPMSADAKPLGDLTRLYTRMLETNFEEALKLIEKRILPTDDQQNTKRDFFETLIQSLDPSIRELHANVLLQCTNICFNQWQMLEPPAGQDGAV